MKIFKFTETDGTQRIFNPMYITDVKLVASEYNKDWCIVIFINDRATGDSTYTMLFYSKEEAQKKLDEISECLESIS